MKQIDDITVKMVQNNEKRKFQVHGRDFLITFQELVEEVGSEDAPEIWESMKPNIDSEEATRREISRRF
jgi:hypothetical protein